MKPINIKCFSCDGEGNSGYDEQGLPFICYRCCGTGFVVKTETQNEIDILNRQILDAELAYDRYYESNGQLDPEYEYFCSASDYMTDEELKTYLRNQPKTRIQLVRELKARNEAKINELNKLITIEGE